MCHLHKLDKVFISGFVMPQMHWHILTRNKHLYVIFSLVFKLLLNCSSVVQKYYFFQGCSASQETFLPSFYKMNQSLPCPSVSIFVPLSTLTLPLPLSLRELLGRMRFFFLPQEKMFIFYWKHVYVQVLRTSSIATFGQAVGRVLIAWLL